VVKKNDKSFVTGQAVHNARGSFQSGGSTRKKIVPTMEEIIPTMKEIIHTTEEIIPTTKEIIHTTEEIVPTMKEIIHTIEEIVPTMKEIIHTRKEMVHKNGGTVFGDEAAIFDVGGVISRTKIVVPAIGLVEFFLVSNKLLS